MNVHSKRLSSGRWALLVLGLAGATISVAAQSQPAKDDKSWTATSETSTANANPSRTTESYTKSGNRTLDRKRVEVLGPDGEYQPYVETEIETIKESPTATRSITRTYNPNPNGDEQLTQVAESETQNSADSSARTLETTSKPDANGNLEVVGREITATTKTATSQDSQTTVYLPDINGGLAPSMRMNEKDELSSGRATYMKKTTLLPDANGNWQVYESQEKTIEGGTQNQTTEDRISRRDFEGNVSPVSREITHQTSGDDRAITTSETYSVDVPGWARDGSFRFLQRSTSVRTVEPGQTVTVQRIEQPDPGDPQMGFGTIAEKTATVVKRNSGTMETIVVTARYPDGYPSVVTVETRNSSQK